MEWKSAPALLPVGVLLAATGLAWEVEKLSIPLATVLLGLGLGLRRKMGPLLAAAACGLLLVALARPHTERAVPFPRSDRPVTVVGHLDGHWKHESERIWAPFRVEILRQGRHVELWPERVVLALPGSDPLPSGSRFRVRGYLRRSPGFANSPAVPSGPWRLWIKSKLLVESEPDGARGAYFDLSQRLRQRLDRVLVAGPEGGPGSHLARALILGDGSAVPDSWRRGLRRLGLSHLLALSGLHVGLMIAVALLAGAWLPPGGRVLLAVGAVCFYLVLAGPRPSLLRASLMGIAAWSAIRLERPPGGANLLAVVAGFLVILDPSLSRQLGFCLTVAATAGLLLLAPRLVSRWVALPQPLRRPLAATVAAQLATLPWTLPAFHLLVPLAPLWNLLAIPWTMLALVIGFVWAGTALLWPAAAVATRPVLDCLAWPFAQAGSLPADITWCWTLRVSAGVATGIAVLLAWASLRPKRRLAWVVLGLLTCRLAGTDAGPDPELVMLDVGQGESILLRHERQAVLIDGGGWRRGDVGGRVVLPVLADLGVHRLQAVVLTHADLDHCGGLRDITSYLSVDEVWTAPGWAGTKCAAELVSGQIRRVRVLWSGEEAAVGDWELRTVHPQPGDRQGTNNRSLVLTATVYGRSVMLTGDVEAAGEKRLLSRQEPKLGAVDILKIPHHGSKSSSSSELLDTLSPRLALISAGVHNRYGHPAPEVLDRLARRRIPVLRTDRHGAIRIAFSPGGQLRIRLPGLPR